MWIDLRNMNETKCKVFELKSTGNSVDEIAIDMKYHIFVAKKTTKSIAKNIIAENWGKCNGLLYKYLDYIWRFQLIEKQVKQFYYNNQIRLLFHSGLYTRETKQPAYIMLVRNSMNFQEKKWRIKSINGLYVHLFIYKSTYI